MTRDLLGRFYGVVQRLTPEHGWPGGRIAVAVSGGPDSFALMHLLHLYTRGHPLIQVDEKPRPRELVAITIDHQLRSESAHEASLVGQLAHRLGISHQTLSVNWNTPPFPARPSSVSKTERPARQARRILLREWLARERMSSLWMAHHRDDQVENWILWGTDRLMKPVTRFDASQWAPSEVEVEPCVLVRPLLEFDKRDLVEWCEHHELPYSTDPTNFDPLHTARNFVRHRLARMQDRHMRRQDKFGMVNHDTGPAHLFRRRVPSASHTFPLSTRITSQTVQIDTPVIGALTLRPWLHDPRITPGATRDFLRQVISAVSPRKHTRVSPSQLEMVRRIIWSPRLSIPRAAFTPGAGVVLEPRSSRGGLTQPRTEWIIYRQAPRRGQVLHTVVLQAGEWTLWDNRFAFRLDYDGIDAKYDASQFVVRVGSSREARRWSLPAIFRRIEGHTREDVVLDLATVAMPSTGALQVGHYRIQWCTKASMQG